MIITDPGAFNLANVTTACVTPAVASFTCQDADAFSFRDGIHPTKAGHAILADEAAKTVQ